MRELARLWHEHKAARARAPGPPEVIDLAAATPAAPGPRPVTEAYTARGAAAFVVEVEDDDEDEGGEGDEAAADLADAFAGALKL
jgi:hypothetical protein